MFNKYADYYDLYYAEKDYAAEVAFILKLAKKFKRKPKTLLDMGCGTGRHLAEFAAQGLVCDGFDLSSKMLQQAKERLAGRVSVGLSLGNLTDFENGKRYDLVVSMFAVMGYLISNNDLLAGFRTARRHLAPGGLFVFDAWFGPAVLAQSPEKRRHEYLEGAQKIVRVVSPELDVVRQMVTVNYEIQVSEVNRLIKTLKEAHQMRYMFVQEVAMALDFCGLRLIDARPFLASRSKLTTDTWNVSFVAEPK